MIATAKSRELVRPTGPLGERGVLRQVELLLLRRSGAQPGVEETRGDRVHPNTQHAEVASHRQGHPCDAGLRRRVGDLSDLTFERGDRCRVDDDATFIVVVRLVRTHVRGAQAIGVERPDEIQIDDGAKVVERQRPGTAEGPPWTPAAGRVDREHRGHRARRPPRRSPLRCPRSRARRTDATTHRVRSRHRRPPTPPGRGSPPFRHHRRCVRRLHGRTRTRRRSG